MAFTEISRQTGTVVRTTATTATDTRNLSSPPAAGQWLVIALYTNQGVISAYSGTGANSLVNSVTCGTGGTAVSLSLLESGLVPSLNAPTVYIAPYQSGMTTAMNINWTNGVAATTLGLAAMVFTGPVTGASSGYAQFRYSTPGTNGAFDSSGYDANGFGLTQAGASSGIISWAQSASGVLTNYDKQGQVFIAASTSTLSFNVNQPRQFGLLGASVDGSGNVTTLGQATGTVLINNATTVVSSGKGVIYSPSGNFVFSYTGTNTTLNTLTGCTTTAPSTASIPGYCQLMLTPNATSTITAVLPTNSLTSGTLGGFQTGNSTAYSGASTANGHVQVTMNPGGTPCRLDLMLGSNISGATSVKAYSNLKISGSNVPVGGGFIYTMVPPTRTMTRTSSVTQVVSSLFRRTWTRVSSALRISSAKDSKSVSKLIKAVRLPIATIARLTALKRSLTALNVFRVVGGRVVDRRRTASTSSVVTATVTRQAVFKRTTSATATYTISSSKIKTVTRRVSAGFVAAANLVREIISHSHTGDLEIDFVVPTVTVSRNLPSVEGSITTADVSISAKILGKA